MLQSRILIRRLMKITFETKDECDSAGIIISNHESNNKNKDNEGIDDVISEIKRAIDVFYIKGFDNIGPITCIFCKRSWVAICSSKSTSLVCPTCKMHNKIPQNIK